MYALVVGGAMNYFKPAAFTGYQPTSNVEVLNNPASVGLVMFTGGEDVSPHLYGHKRHVTTGINLSRDNYEVDVFNRLRALGDIIPTVGICRGAQFLCVMAGGSLIQDVTGHAGPGHKLIYLDDNMATKLSPEIVTSTHHQMQYPWDLPKESYRVLAWSPYPISRHYAWKDKEYSRVSRDGVPNEFDMEPDVVLYRSINALAIQYHPEYMAEDSWGFKFAQKHIQNLIKACQPIG